MVKYIFALNFIKKFVELKLPVRFKFSIKFIVQSRLQTSFRQGRMVERLGVFLQKLPTCKKKATSCFENKSARNTKEARDHVEMKSDTDVLLTSEK